MKSFLKNFFSGLCYGRRLAASRSMSSRVASPRFTACIEDVNQRRPYDQRDSARVSSRSLCQPLRSAYEGRGRLPATSCAPAPPMGAVSLHDPLEMAAGEAFATELKFTRGGGGEPGNGADTAGWLAADGRSLKA